MTKLGGIANTEQDQGITQEEQDDLMVWGSRKGENSREQNARTSA